MKWHPNKETSIWFWSCWRAVTPFRGDFHGLFVHSNTDGMFPKNLWSCTPLFIQALLVSRTWWAWEPIVTASFWEEHAVIRQELLTCQGPVALRGSTLEGRPHKSYGIATPMVHAVGSGGIRNRRPDLTCSRTSLASRGGRKKTALNSWEPQTNGRGQGNLPRGGKAGTACNR